MTFFHKSAASPYICEVHDYEFRMQYESKLVVINSYYNGLYSSLHVVERVITIEVSEPVQLGK